MSDELTRYTDFARSDPLDRPLDTFDYDFNQQMNRALIHKLATPRCGGWRLLFFALP